VLVKLWKEQFPEHSESPELWRTHYFPEGKDDTKVKVLRKKRTTVTRKRKAVSESKDDSKDDSKVVAKKPRKNRKTFRNQTTHPQGVRYSSTDHTWPVLDHEWNPRTIWIDEAGMGCWAGPLHVGGTVLLPGFDIQGIHDSKLLKEHEREAVYEKLLKDPHIIWHVESVPNTKVDELKLGEAWRYAIRRVITALKTRVETEHPEITLDQVILDGNKTVLETDIPVTPIPKADRLYAGVAAASVLAKVSRDKYMAKVAPQYPEYFEIFTKGHGYRHSAKHDELVKAGKYTDLHRKSYNPLRDLLQKGVLIRADRKANTPPKVLTLQGPMAVVGDILAPMVEDTE
jgi:ribonuclease HII